MPIQIYHTHGILFTLFLFSKLATAQPPPPPPLSPPDSQSYNFSSAMATTVIVLIILFFSIGFISVYIRHFVLSMGISLGRDTNGGNEGWRRGRSSRRGLDPAIINDFPTFLYSDVKTHRMGKSSLECAICLNEFSELEILRMLPPCSHVFHPHCVGTWLANHVTCPICRANLEISDGSRSLSFNYLANNNQFEQSSDNDDCNSSNHDDGVIVQLEMYPGGCNAVILSPGCQEPKTLNLDSPVRALTRSHSTGHSLVEDPERHTLRLTDEVRKKLVNVNLRGLPAAIVSPRVGYRARRVGGTNTEAGKLDHWRFLVSPPFISRSNSTRSQKSESAIENNNNNSVGIMSGPKGLFKSIKSPINRVSRSDDIGERSTNQLWVNKTTQESELEDQWKQDE